jgi:MFS family permease
MDNNQQSQASVPHKKGKVLAVLFVGVLMGALDIAIVGPAIPSIQQTISIAAKDLGWISSIYVLFNLVGISLFAKLSDIFGRRSIYMINVTVFAIGSLIVAFSHSLPMLLLGRAVQGFGASGIFPVASAVIGDIFPPEKRGRALGMIGAVWGVAFLLGPVLAGTLMAFFSWHVLFLINIPIALGLLYFSSRLLSPKGVSTDKRFDWRGIIYLGLFLGLFTYAANNIVPSNFLSSIATLQVAPYLLSSFAFLALLIREENKTDVPVIRLKLFLSRQVKMVALVGVSTGLFQACFVFVPTFAVTAFAVKPKDAAFMLLPFILATAIGSPFFGRMLDKLGSRFVVMTGLVLASTGLIFLSRSVHSSSTFYVAGAFIGLGLSILAGSSLRYIMLNEVTALERASTQGIVTIFMSIGQIIGGPIIGASIANYASKLDGFSFTFLYISFYMILIAALSSLFKGRKEELALIKEKHGSLS